MKKCIPVLIAFLVLLTGCESSMYRLLYNSMDSLVYRSVAWYIEPDPDQERFLKERIGAHLHWHRRTELLKYASTFQGLRERMVRGLREEDAAWAMARVRRHEADFFKAIAGDVAAFLVSLGAEQVDRLDRRMGERIAEIERKVSLKDKERVREETKSMARIMEYIYGGLTERQKEDISRVARGLENIDPLRMRLYRDRRAEFIALLRSRPDRKAVMAYLGRLAAAPGQSLPDYYRVPAERRDRRLTEEFLRFNRELATPEQRRHAVGRIDLLIRTARELAAE